MVWNSARLADAAKAIGPPLLFGLRLWLSVCLALYIAFWLELDNAYWAGTSAAIVCQPSLGASLRKGWFRMVGTVIGAVAIVVLTACFPQDRAPFLICLALWGAACALFATLLRNFASYAAALAGFTAAIIAGDQFGATGGPNGEAFTLAVMRVSEICIGIVCAGVVLASTDFGGARRKLASLIAAVTAEIAGRFSATLAVAGAGFDETQVVRRELIRRVIALDPVIDEAMGESSELRYHSPVLQDAVSGLLSAMAGWRTAAVLLLNLPQELARREAADVLARVPQEARLEGDPTRWMTDPIGLRRGVDAAARGLIALRVSAPSLRLLADQTAQVLAGVLRALDGLALLTDPHRTHSRRPGGRRPYIPDWLPSLVNGGRAFVTICAVSLFWIITQWPSGASAITFATVGVLVLAPRADQAYAAAISFMLGTGISAILAAIVAFAVLPRLESFVAFSLAIGIVLIPAGAGVAQPRQTVAFVAMTANFIPLLAPANPMSYDTLQFYNSALAIVGGLGAAALSFRLIPPLSPAYRTRRLLALSLRDLRRLIIRPVAWAGDDWEGLGYSRLFVMPDEATPLQRAHLLAVLLVGAEIIQLYRSAGRLGVAGKLASALEFLARGDVARAVAGLTGLDSALAATGMPAALRARARILAVSEAVSQHAVYFGTGAAG